MAHIHAIPAVYICLLAPFVSDKDHTTSIRRISGIFAYMQDIEGLKSIEVVPDLFIAAFWKRGAERAFFHRDLVRRKGDFMLCLNLIWDSIDAIAESEKRLLSKVEILGIALDTYRSVMIQGFKLQHMRLWQNVGITLDPWSVAAGALDPLTSIHATAEERAGRRGYADVSHFRMRVSIFRLSSGRHVGTVEDHERGRRAAMRTPDSGKLDFVQERPSPLSPSFSDPDVDTTDPYETDLYKGPDTFEEYDENTR